MRTASRLPFRAVHQRRIPRPRTGPAVSTARATVSGAHAEQRAGRPPADRCTWRLDTPMRTSIAGALPARCRVRRRSALARRRSGGGPFPAAAARVARVSSAVEARKRGDVAIVRDGATSARSCAAPDQTREARQRAGGAGRTGDGSHVAARTRSSRARAFEQRARDQLR